MKQVVTGVTLMLLVLSPALRSAVAQGGQSALVGVVRDGHGTPQMGALIELLGPSAAVIAQTYTDDHGRYVLNALRPGRYEVRASAAFSFPSLRPNLRLNPGVRSLANLTLTAMMEVGVWFPAQRRGLEEPSDDWRWTLRSAANRPLLRLDGEADSELESVTSEAAKIPATEGQYLITSGNGSFGGGGTHEVFTLTHAERDGSSAILRADLGQVTVPEKATSMDVDTGFKRRLGPGGETRVVASFSSHPELVSADLKNADLGTPGHGGLQVFTLASSEHMALGDAVMIDAGTLLSAERLAADRVSSAPFLRVVVAPVEGFAVMYRYATAREVQGSDDLASTALQPEVLSDAAGRPLPFGNRHQEIALSHADGVDTETVTFYRDNLDAAAVEGMGGADQQQLFGMPVVVDLGTNTFRATVHGYQAQGVSLSWTHQVSSSIAASAVAEMGSTLGVGNQPLTIDSLGQSLKVRMRPAFAASVVGKLQRTGTAYRAQYRWQPSKTLNTVDAYNTASEQGYLSCTLRQKLWSGRRLQGLDAVLEATNLLEEGYQPVVAPDGETIFLAQVPRSMQAGLAFKF